LLAGGHVQFDSDRRDKLLDGFRPVKLRKINSERLREKIFEERDQEPPVAFARW
jgi:hypothetical protein